MSPTLRHEPRGFGLDAAISARTPTRARWFAVAVLTSALALVVALLIGGASLPSAGPLLVLAVPLALCMNRYLFFPNEVGVTADAAVIFAAMVGFRGDAQWLGPLVVALLAGPLDARHWGARAFTRMAYNSGSSALVTAAGLSVFVALTRELGTGWESTLAAAAVAAVPYFVTETMLGVALVTLLAERPAIAVRHQAPLNAIVLPLAVIGALAGLAAIGVGWWCAVLLLLPIPLTPELVLVVLPRRLGVRATVDLGLVAVGIALVGLSVTITDPAANLVIGVVGLGCLLAVENPPRRSALTPPSFAVLAAATVALSFDGSTVAMTLVAAAAGVAYLGIVRVEDRRAWWSLPLVAYVAAVAVAARQLGSVRVAMVAAAVLVGLVAAAAWGPLPWSSRRVGPFAGAQCSRTRLPTLVCITIGAPVLAFVAVASDGTAPAVAAMALIELGVFAVALAVRLWRFAPRRRAVELTVLATMGALASPVTLALHGVPIAVVILLVQVLLLIVVARPLIALGRSSSVSRAPRIRVPGCAAGTVSKVESAPDRAEGGN